MRILDLYLTTTGNTQKVAERIDQTLRDLGHEVDSVKVGKETEVDVLAYDCVFVGSGVYAWLPGKPMQSLLESLREGYAQKGLIRPASPRIDKQAVIYCTYGGVHTGVNEAIPAVKFMGQLFDHLGFEIVDEWYFAGEYRPARMQAMTRGGRLGDITGRPDEHDLREVEQKVRGIMLV
jgi:flavodoxin